MGHWCAGEEHTCLACVLDSKPDLSQSRFQKVSWKAAPLPQDGVGSVQLVAIDGFDLHLHGFLAVRYTREREQGLQVLEEVTIDRKQHDQSVQLAYLPKPLDHENMPEEFNKSAMSSGLLVPKIAGVLCLLLDSVYPSHRKHKLAHVPRYPQPLRPLRHHPHVQAHVPVPSRLPRIVAPVEPVLHPHHLHPLVLRDRMQAARQVLQVLEHDALTHDVHQARDNAVVGARELLDGAIDALEVGPLDALEQVRVELGVDPPHEVHVVI
mmetsp:Transcript_34321/g.107575  ORF Transcript_34321/g.107575 Transcript_34321/m.107575 type:complete len:266 (+) Transcript_34321:1424-2221(+)